MDNFVRSSSDEEPLSVTHVGLAGVASLASYLIARLFGLPEAYWAPMSTLLVMKVTIEAALPIAIDYVTGTAVGAAVGAAVDVYGHGRPGAFAAAIIFIGLLSVAFRVNRSTFRYAGITLVIVLLVPRSTNGRLVGFHRFSEVSIGIAVGLACFVVWQKVSLWLSTKRAQPTVTL